MNSLLQCPFCEMENGLGVVLPPNLRPKGFTVERNPMVLNRSSVLVTPDIAPIFSGHLLVIPKQHSFSLLTLSEDVRAEMLDSMRSIQQFNLNKLGLRTVFFEHGTCNDHSSSCVQHCHIHSLPLAENYYDAVIAEVQHKCGEPEEVVAGENYLMFGQDVDQLEFWDDKGISQWFRKLLTSILGQTERAAWRNCLINEVELNRTLAYLEETINIYAALN